MRGVVKGRSSVWRQGREGGVKGGEVRKNRGEWRV